MARSIAGHALLVVILEGHIAPGIEFCRAGISAIDRTAGQWAVA